MNWLYWVFVGEFAAMFAAWLVFVITYAVVTRGSWWRTLVGRFIMSLGAAFTWNAGLVLFNIAVRSYPGRVPLQLVSYAVFTALGVTMTVMLLRAQRARRTGRSLREWLRGDPVDSQ